MYQVNFFIFTLCITGIYYYSKNKVHLSAIFFLIATFIKVFPVFFLLYVVIKHVRSKKVILYTLTGFFLCVTFSISPRGFETGINDHITYYFTFLDEFQKGEVITWHTNHTLKAFILKAFYPETRNIDINTSIYTTPLQVGNFFLFAIFIILMVMSVIVVKSKESKNLIINFSLIFIFTHLVSGITWTAHLVTMMFSYLPLFLLDVKKIHSIVHKVIHIILIITAFFLAIEGKDTTGEWLYYKLRYADIFVIYPLILFTYYCFIIINKIDAFYNTSTVINPDSRDVLEKL